MTKEELEKEAEEWLNKWELCNKCDHKAECIEECSYCYLVVKRAYLAGAEPREKEIKVFGERCLQLQKDKGNLTDKCKELEAQLNKLKPYRCKNHYAVSEKETSNVVLCYKVQNCESCGHFKE